MNEKNNIFEEEISLAPPMSLLEEAAEVAKVNASNDYRVTLKNGSRSLLMQELVDYCENLNN